MQKPTVLLLSMAVLVAAGIGLSIYASQIVFEGLDIAYAQVRQGSPLEVSSTIPPGKGILAVAIMDHTDGMSVSFEVLGPLGYVMAASTVTVPEYQETFDVQEESEYTLIIRSDSADPIQVTGVIGPEPGASTSSLAFVSLYVLLVGMVGMIASVAYIIVVRRRAGSGMYPSV